MTGQRRWFFLVGLMVLSSLVGCRSKGEPTPTFVPTLLVPTATATPRPTPTATATATPQPTPTEIPLAARVNGQPIFLADLERGMDQIRAALVAEGWDMSTPDAQARLQEERQWMLNALIEQMLYEQAAQVRGIVVTDEQVDAIVQHDIEQIGREEFDDWLTLNDMKEEEYWGQTRANLLSQEVNSQVIDELPTSSVQVHARHILVATREEAEAILEELRGGADFATLAQTYSLDVSTRDNGGDLNFFPRGLLLAPEVEEVAFALAPGEASQVVESMLGFHIVQVLEREERPVSPNDQAALQRFMIRQWVEEMWAKATIERYLNP